MNDCNKRIASLNLPVVNKMSSVNKGHNLSLTRMACVRRFAFKRLKTRDPIKLKHAKVTIKTTRYRDTIVLTGT